LFFALLAACNDYDLEAKQDPAEEALDSAAPGDSAPPASDDTASTGDSGSAELPDTDPEIATEPIYLNTGNTLYSYDPGTNTASAVGSFTQGGVRVTDMTDIAIDLGGRMYGVAYDELYRVTPATAEVTHIATLDASFNALTFVSDGTLVAAGDNQVVSVDTSTGRTARIGRNDYTSSGDIVGLPDGMLYWSTQGGGSDDLVKIDPTTGSATRLGAIGSSGVYALGYANGELYGFTSGNKALVIDATTGKATSEQKLTGSWWGATTNPVLW
jgi:hypothetical protein